MVGFSVGSLIPAFVAEANYPSVTFVIGGGFVVCGWLFAAVMGGATTRLDLGEVEPEAAARRNYSSVSTNSFAPRVAKNLRPVVAPSGGGAGAGAGASGGGGGGGVGSGDESRFARLNVAASLRRMLRSRNFVVLLIGGFLIRFSIMDLTSAFLFRYTWAADNATLSGGLLVQVCVCLGPVFA